MEEVPEEREDCAVSCSWTSADTESALAPTARARIWERPKGRGIHPPAVGGTTELLFSLHFASVWCCPGGTIPKLYLKPRSGDVPGRKPTVPLLEEWASCAHTGYIPEEGKKTSVCLFPVAVITRHGHPSCPLQPRFGARWCRSHEPCVWHSNNSLGNSYPWLRRSKPLTQGQQMLQRQDQGRGQDPHLMLHPNHPTRYGHCQAAAWRCTS